jgi:hypothetical protein
VILSSKMQPAAGTFVIIERSIVRNLELGCYRPGVFIHLSSLRSVNLNLRAVARNYGDFCRARRHHKGSD